MTSWTVEYKPQGSVPKDVELVLNTPPSPENRPVSTDCIPSPQQLTFYDSTLGWGEMGSALILEAPQVDTWFFMRMNGKLCDCPFNIEMTEQVNEDQVIFVTESLFVYANGGAILIRPDQITAGNILTFTPTVCGKVYPAATITFT